MLYFSNWLTGRGGNSGGDGGGGGGDGDDDDDDDDEVFSSHIFQYSFFVQQCVSSFFLFLIYT